MVFSIQGSRPIWQQLTEQLARDNEAAYVRVGRSASPEV